MLISIIHVCVLQQCYIVLMTLIQHVPDFLTQL